MIDESKIDAAVIAPADPTPNASTSQDASGQPDMSGQTGNPPRPTCSGKMAYGLASATSILYFLAFPGMDFWPLSFVALVPILIALRGQTLARATKMGLWAGFLVTMIGFYWLVEMLKVFSGFPTPVCFLFAALLCVYQGGRIGLCTHLYARAARRGWPHALVFAAAFGVSELCWPLLFPWYFSASIHQVPLLMQTAELGGPIFVSLVLVSANLVVAALVERLLYRIPIARKTVLLGTGITVAAVIYGAVRLVSVDALIADSESVKVGLVQGNMALTDRRNSLKVHRKRTIELRKKGAELVVWSEAAIPRAFDERRYEKTMPQAVTRDLGVPVVVGGVLYRRIKKTTGKGRRSQLFNVALMADDKGKLVGRYDKRYLLMFGEHLPLGDVFPILYEWSPNSGNFHAGTSLQPLKIGDHRLSAMICYEDILPGYVNDLVRAGDPDLLVNLTNDSWFGDTTEPWIHLALAKFRSVEHRRYLIRVTNSGVSAIVDAAGRVVVQGGTFKEEALLGEARYMRVRTPYALVGDIPWWLLTAALLAGCIIPRRRKDPSIKGAQAS